MAPFSYVRERQNVLLLGPLLGALEAVHLDSKVHVCGKASKLCVARRPA
jgi:hypothetical protein